MIEIGEKTWCHFLGDDWYFTATFVHLVGQMGRATSKGVEAKSKTKHPSDIPTPRFEHGWYRSVIRRATVRPRREGAFRWGG